MNVNKGKKIKITKTPQKQNQRRPTANTPHRYLSSGARIGTGRPLASTCPSASAPARATALCPRTDGSYGRRRRKRHRRSLLARLPHLDVRRRSDGRNRGRRDGGRGRRNDGSNHRDRRRNARRLSSRGRSHTRRSNRRHNAEDPSGLRRRHACLPDPRARTPRSKLRVVSLYHVISNPAYLPQEEPTAARWRFNSARRMSFV